MPYTESFLKLKQALQDNYLHHVVPKEFQDRYGKRYDKADIKQFAYAVAKSKGIKIDK